MTLQWKKTIPPMITTHKILHQLPTKLTMSKTMSLLRTMITNQLFLIDFKKNNPNSKNKI